MFGVVEDRRALPTKVSAVLDPEHNVYADFEVCPFTQARPNHMQFVCVESASQIYVQKRR
jgi:hypothetical protein